MIEHPFYTYNAFAVEQERIDRANERRRFIAENPERIVQRERSLARRVRGWFGGRRSDAATLVAASDGAHAASDRTARPAHAR